MPYQAYKFNKLQESRRPDKRSASGNFAFVIRLNPGMKEMYGIIGSQQ